MPSKPHVFTAAHLGRDTDANVRHFDAVQDNLGYLPRLRMGVRPRKSPDNRAYISRRYCAQLIGDCTAESIVHAAEYLLRTPSDRVPGSAPLPERGLSALWTYWNGRNLARQEGYQFGGDGCIGSIVAYAAQKSGFAPIADYPPTDDNYRGYSDDLRPPDACFSEGPRHVLGEVKLLPDFESILTLLSLGYVVPVGTDIHESMMDTDDAGRWNITGQVVGGHEYVLLDYDEDADWIDVWNSWANGDWGMRENHPDQSPLCHGFNNVGRTSLTDYANAYWTPSRMASGASEALGVNTVQGWLPLASFAGAL